MGEPIRYLSQSIFGEIELVRPNKFWKRVNPYKLIQDFLTLSFPFLDLL